MTGWLKQLRDHTESDLVSTEDFEVKRRLLPLSAQIRDGMW
jgi:hypothetical protein